MQRSAQFLMSLLAGLALTMPAAALVINVPGDALTIQAGIISASNGDTVLVADGTYYENIDFLGKAIIVTSVNGPATTTIDGGGVDWVVTFKRYEGRDSVIEGFTITNGTGGIEARGFSSSVVTSPTIRDNIISNSTIRQGIYGFRSDPLIEGNIITGNMAGSNGGGIKLDFSDGVIRHNEITGNSNTSSGGGIFTNGSRTEISGNLINDNSASQAGGILVYTGQGLLVNNEVSGNHAATYGGGIYVSSANHAEVRDNIITGNTCDYQGGGIYTDGGWNIRIVGNRISGNSAEEGGGVFGYHRQTITFSNNLVSENTSTGRGGGMRFATCTADLLNNTIIHNQAGGTGGGIHISGSTISLTHNILYFNTASTTASRSIQCLGWSIALSYCCVEGGQSSVNAYPEDLFWGAGMITGDPLFVDGPYGPASLSQTSSGQAADSPCRNAGNNWASDVGYDTNLGFVTMNQMSTRSDQIADTGIVDLGWHNKGWPSNTVGAWMSSNPQEGTLPFSSQFTVGLINRYLAQTRRFALKVDASLANGTNYPNWRAGWTNLEHGETFSLSWGQYFPALGSLVGLNQFSLTAVDVTPAPFNQPPYPPAGDTATGSSSVTGIAP